ncbi:PQQ-binding-like beta-propeller repeat protein [Paenibacillus xylanilyticus]|uniref:outer membrane protein assembly factor BamB family protein n=1 Tax=Paenibacillus xylanilyticus TaxID=248903 RepID=UPI00399FCA24
MKATRKQTLSRLVKTSVAVALFLSPVSAFYKTGLGHVSAASSVNNTSINLKPFWTKTVGDPNKINTRATLLENDLYYTVGNKYIAFDALAGKSRWTIQASAVSQTVTDGQSVWFTDAKGQLLKLDAKTGKLQWKVKTQVSPKKGERYSNFSLHLADGVIYVGDEYGLTAYHASNGKVKWKTKGHDNGFKVLQTGDMLVVSTTISGALTTSGLQGIEAKTGKVKWTQTDGNHQDILFSNGQTFYSRDVSEGIDGGYAANIDEIRLSNGTVKATRSYIPVDFVEVQSASDVVSDGDYFYVIGKYDDQQKQAVISRFPVDGRSGGEPDKTYAFDVPVVDWSFANRDGVAYVSLDNGNQIALDTNSGKTLASVHYKGNPLQTIVGQDVMIVQHGANFSGVKVTSPANRK